MLEDDLKNKLINKEIEFQLNKLKKKMDTVYYEFRDEMLKSIKEKITEIYIGNISNVDVEENFLSTLQALIVNNSICERDNCILLDAKCIYSELENFHKIDKRNFNKLLKQYDAVRTQKNANRVTILLRIDGEVRSIIAVKKSFIDKYNLKI